MGLFIYLASAAYGSSLPLGRFSSTYFCKLKRQILLVTPILQLKETRVGGSPLENLGRAGVPPRNEKVNLFPWLSISG